MKCEKDYTLLTPGNWLYRGMAKARLTGILVSAT